MAEQTAFDWAQVVDYARRYTSEIPKTQYELPGVTLEEHDGVPVVVPPLWHAVVTVELTMKAEPSALQDAQGRLGRALAQLERVYPVVPAGLFVQIAYGLPYFRQFIGQDVLGRYMPRTVENGRAGEWAVKDAIRFPKDPSDLALEQNHMCFHFKSDFHTHIEDAIAGLFYPGRFVLNGMPVNDVYVGDLFRVTSIRKGFVGRNMPKTVAQHFHLPQAAQIPAGAELFLGFTSSHLHGLAAGNLPSFETIPGYTDQTPDSYFAHGTFMHLSHIALDLEKWYDAGYKKRLQRMFDARRTEAEGVLSPDQAPRTSTFRKALEEDAKTYHLVGHNEQMQFLSRVNQTTETVYGQSLPRGTVFFLRQDFDTIENPFAFSSSGPSDPTPRPGVHFIGFGPSAQYFERLRLQMDSEDVQRAHGLANEDLGITGFLSTTHRQNFLLPPRGHRSFPLAEFA